MQMSQKGIDHINVIEGRIIKNGRHVMYRDVVELPTIGYGHLITKTELSTGKIYTGKETVSWNQGLTEQQADDLLDRDLDRFEQVVNTCVTVELSQFQFEALVSFSFNIGVSAFRNSTLLIRVNSKDWDDVPYQFKRWKKAGGKIIQGLINRREKEIALWFGNYIE